MRLKDQFRFVRQNMKKNKARVFMTILATAMGCAFLIVLASIGFGLQKTVVDDAMEQQIVTEIDVFGYTGDDGDYRELTIDDIDYLESVDDVKSVTRRNQLYQMPTFTVDDYQGEANAVVADFPSEMKSGLEVAEGKLPEEPNEVVVGYQFMEQLADKSVEDDDIYDDNGEVKSEYQYEGKVIGKNVDMIVEKVEDGEGKKHTLPVTIVGILEEPTKEWEQDQDVYISQDVLLEVEDFTGTKRGDPDLENAQDVSNEDADTFDEVTVYAKNVEAVKGISEELEENNYATYSIVSEMKQINTLFTIAKTGLILVGTIAIIIASIGIYNTMTMAVTERAPDIGIMKAIGANPKTIKKIFLLESTFIGLMGAAIGTIIAYVISFLVNLGLPVILEMAFEEEFPEGLQFSSIPLILVVIAVGICLVVTILSGNRPAKRATKIDVLQAMRREI